MSNFVKIQEKPTKLSTYRTYTTLNLPTIDKDIRKYWKEERIFEKSVQLKDSEKTFTFYEGPPSANGSPGIHHVMARAIKDIFCRYKTLKGFRVERKAGWDTHGLPVELSVEKNLQITKEDIGTKISVEDFNKACLAQVTKYTDEWNNLTEKVGYWVDMDEPYRTYETDYVESLWWILKQVYEKGKLYKGYSIQPYSPKAGSSLSSHELSQPGCYRNVKDTSITAQFRVIKSQQSEFLFTEEKEEVFFLAWTTTPWTLPSNCALAVGKDIRYVKVKTFNPYTKKPVSIIFAENLISKILRDKIFYQVDSFDKIILDGNNEKIPFFVENWNGKQYMTGEKLTDIKYDQLMPYVTNDNLTKNAFRIIIGDFVNTDEGTGIVHTASIFGADDYRICMQNHIPSVLVEDEAENSFPLVDKQGRFVKEVSDLAMRYVKEEYYSDEEKSNPNFKSTDVLIAIKLKTENKAFWVEKYEHSYPFCWRTDAPVLYYPVESWFIKTTDYRDRLIALNKSINWKPEATGVGRFGNWLENLVDWNLSRSRFWGTPLPIWRTKDGGEEICIGSLDELQLEAQKSFEKGFISKSLFDQIKDQKNIDLHKPFVDKIILTSTSGKQMFRENDLVDVWFDSGAMPYAQWHYPFENQEKFKTTYPADFISEGVDQTRGWFFTLHAIATILNDSVAFKNVVSTGLVLDEQGNKMSKRKGNTVNPFECIEKYGADAIRLYMICNAAPWENLKFSLTGLEIISKKFFGTYYNTYLFFVIYANIDEFRYQQKDIDFEKRPELDKWILSTLNTLIKTVDRGYENYEPHTVGKSIIHFMDVHLSNWFVRLSRRRFWKDGTLAQTDKLSAFQTLYTCLITVAKLISPIAPFYSERIFLDLNGITHKEKAESVHLTDFPKYNSAFVDKSLEERMSLAQDICSLVFSIRKKININVRQPLPKMVIPVLNERIKNQIDIVRKIILTETNVREIQFVDSDSDIVVKKVKPNFKVLGPKYGKEISTIVREINQLDRNLIAKLESEKSLYLESIDKTLLLEDVDIFAEDIPGWQIANSNQVTLALDITLTEDLKKEGIAREIVNRIQNLRKEKGFDIVDRIKIHIENHSYIRQVVEEKKDYIMSETLAKEISPLNGVEDTEIKVYENNIKVALTKI